MNRLITYVMLIVLSVCIWSCEKVESYELLTGDLVGAVQLSGFPRALSDDNSGVEIVAEGGDLIVSAISDQSGFFELKGLTTGSYNIFYRKDGYAQLVIPGFQFVGGTVATSVGNRYLSKLPTVQVDELKITSQFDNKVQIEIQFSDQVKLEDGYLLYYISNTPDVSYRSYNKSGFFYYNFRSNIWADVDKSAIINPFIEFDPVEFPSGTQLYLIVYSGNPGDVYTDPDTGCLIYPVNAEKPSAVESFVID